MCKQTHRSLKVLFTSELGWNRQEREPLRHVQSQKAPPQKIFTSHLDSSLCFPPGSRYHVLVHATNALSSPNQSSQLHPGAALHQRKMCRWQSVNEAFKFQELQQILADVSQGAITSPSQSHKNHHSQLKLPVTKVFSSLVFPDSTRLWKGAVVNRSAGNVMHSSFSLFAEAFVSSWWMLRQHLLRF